jgi:hypothetical protein
MALDNQNIQFTSFLNVPGAVQISGSELIPDLNEQEHPIFIAPELPWYLSPTTIMIPPINFDDLINLLDEILDNTGKIEVSKINKCCYSIQFQPVDGIKMYPKDILHHNKWLSMTTAVNEAIKKFPHNIPDFDPHEPPHNDLIFRNEWFKMEIRIYYSVKEHSYTIDFNRMRGDSSSFYKIYRILESKINETFSTANVLWLMRNNYINLYEGCPYDENHENHENHENQITRYLFNELLIKEICTYI